MPCNRDRERERGR
jgi:hypothetical protein